MKASVIVLSISALVSAGTLPQRRAAGGYVQVPSGNASFTNYGGCNQPACGVASTGFSAAMNQQAFGSVPGLGPGDACGRCFAITGNSDPFSPAFPGPFGKSIIVKVTDLCPVAGNEEWCGQSASAPQNKHGKAVHFDICTDTGGAAQFFPSGHGALTGTFSEVSCSQWSGSDGAPLFNGACIKGETAANWPATACGNQGLSPGAPGPPASTVTVTGTTTGSPTTTAPGSTQTQFGQCGGTGYTGPTVCVTPFTCTPISPPFYSQCL
ncbi:RlpA-like double-psi beta-barrel-protein domain-containing protein-containing protein [Mycena rebaudengoi]|nr:RlpA-like double-psi beta-barrel-protein domain-containing protein-containing protein [Mycena rebaudengoi]